MGWDLRIWFSSGLLFKPVKAVFVCFTDLLYYKNSSLGQHNIFSGVIYASHLMQDALDLS